ncbi:MAG: hypothetical protein AB8G11_10895 [Saprospiraceae bacterium]
MTIFEWIAIISAFIWAINIFKQPKYQRFLTGMTVFFLTSALLDTFRWQLFPIIAAAILLLVISIPKKPKKWLNITVRSLSVLLILIGTALAYFLPVFEFPTPTGKFSVSKKTMTLIDSTRQEMITEAPDDLREIGLSIWYPSNEVLEKTEKYLSDGLSAAFAESKGVPAFALSYFSNIETHTEKDLAFANGQFPVIILSHGYIWNAELYNAIIEEIVSQGYIIVGIQHSYEAPLVQLTDRKVKPELAYFQRVNANFDFDKFNSLQQEFQLAPDSSKLSIMQKMMRSLPYNESVKRWQNDISFVIDELEKRQNEDFFKQLDLDKIAALGHSFGGSAVAQTCAYDNRIKAGINMDGAQWGNLIDTIFNVPFLALYADRDYDSFFTPNFYTYSQVAKNELISVIIKNAGHANFGDLGYWTPLHQFTETGTIHPNRMNELTTDLILTFLEKHLENKAIDMKEKFKNVEELEFVD